MAAPFPAPCRCLSLGLSVAWLALTPAQAAAETPSGGPSPDSSGPDAELIVGIATGTLGTGLLVGLIAMAARVSALESDPGFVAYRRAFGPDQSACEHARAGVEVSGAGTAEGVAGLCDEAETLEVLTAAVFPAGVALLTLGSYLFFSSETVQGSPEQTALTVLPLVSHSGAGALLTYTF